MKQQHVPAVSGVPAARRCGGCGAPDALLVSFLDLGRTPLANTYRDSIADVEAQYPLKLCRCVTCGLVQQAAMVPDELVYGSSYGFYSGGSGPQRAYHRRTAEQLGSYVDRDQLVVEIACNDGSLLEHFVEQGYTKLLGIDPSAPADDAIALGLPVKREPFTAELATTIRAGLGPASLVIAQHVLAHVVDLGDMLTGIWELMDDGGLAVVDVQYLPDLLAGNMYDQVYHEHRYHFSLGSFQRAALLRGLHVVDAELIDFQNGSIRIYLARHRVTEMTRRARDILMGERWTLADAPYESMQGRVERIRARLLDLMGWQIDDGRVIGGFAASAKATTILNFCHLELPYVLDSTPYKQGRFVPGTQTPIVADDKEILEGRSPTYLLLAANYLGAVLRDRCEYLSNGGRWIVPVPNPIVI